MDTGDIFIAFLFRNVDQVTKRNRPDAEFVIRVKDQFLRIEWAIEGVTFESLPGLAWSRPTMRWLAP